jgi:hypothetical protein
MDHRNSGAMKARSPAPPLAVKKCARRFMSAAVVVNWTAEWNLQTKKNPLTLISGFFPYN